MHFIFYMSRSISKTYRVISFIVTYLNKVNEHILQFVVYCTNNEVLRYNDVTFTVRYI